jgi:translation elongation factor EF-G
MEQLTLLRRSIYDIRMDHVRLIQIIEDNDGEVTPEIEGLLQLTGEEFENKALSYALVTKHFEDEETILTKEIERLSSRLRQVVKRKDLFRQVLSSAMQQFGVEKIETATLRLSFRKSQSVEILDETIIPDRYFDNRTITTVSKTRIKEDLKEGKVVPGASLSTIQNLQIK